MDNPTKQEMIIHFFKNHQCGQYTTKDIAQYIYNNFSFPNKPKTHDGIKAQLHREICANMAIWFKNNGNKKYKRNFTRTKTKNIYQYSFMNTKQNTQQINNQDIKKQTHNQSFDINLLKQYITKAKDKNKAIKEILNIATSFI